MLQVILVNGPTLSAGTHYIPFSLNLPHGTPSTYESQYGHVRCALIFTLAEALYFSQGLASKIELTIY